MSWMETLNRNLWPLYLLGGLFLGTFIGYKVLPKLLSPPVAAVVETESAAQLLARQSLETSLAEGLVLFDGVDAAHVQLSVALAGTRKAAPRASVTLTLTDTGLPEEELLGMAEQMAASVDGLNAGRIMFVDSAGRLLNGDAVLEYERKVFWKGIAINVAKVLGILAALITLRFTVQAIGKGIGVEEENGGC